MIESFYGDVYEQLVKEPTTAHCKVKFTPETPVSVYEQTYSAYYETPNVDIYFYDQPSGNYFQTETLVPGTQYYYWSQPTQEFTEYIPTPVNWSEYYETPTEDLYYYDSGLTEYIPIAEPSPYIDYVYYDSQTEEYVDYEPTPVEWSTYYEQPTT